MATIRCAVGLPNVGEYGDPRVLMDLAQRAEGAGWDGVFIWDHVAYRERGWPVADPYVTLAAIAATSVRVRLGIMVTALARRRPWKLAREVASLDVLSGGRLVVGVGLGSQAYEEFAAFGEDPDLRARAELVDEGLEILVGLLSGDRFAYRGRHYTVAETVFRPRPVQRPRPPIWIAGRWPARRPFQRAARFDGVFPTFQGVEHDQRPTPDQLLAVVEYARSQRDPADGGFDVVLEAQSDGPDPGLVGEYADVGLTWWIEKLGWFRGPIDFTRQRIDQGPR
jgi:alkanesulfonate monooxygenase SsuD/methylene tetrahydromethanopterin reductase-like flavin-dependent oxidoreductase (luciferase family)